MSQRQSMSRSCNAYTPGCDKVDVRFTTQYDVTSATHVVGVTGSYRYLGSWDPKHAFLLERRGIKGCWSSVVQLPLSNYFEWKLIIIDKNTRRVQKWEEYPNRWDWVDRGPLEIIAGWNNKEMIRCSSCRCLVGICCCTTIYTNLAPLESLVDVKVSVIHSIDTDETIALIGSTKFLGDWDPTVSRLFHGHHNPTLSIRLPMNNCFEYKLAVLNRRHRKVMRWEECENRTLRVQTCPFEVGISWGKAAVIGFKCKWLDTLWVVTPCPCETRYCYNTDLVGDDKGPRKSVRNILRGKPIITLRSSILRTHDQTGLNKKPPKTVHFPVKPVTCEFERTKGAETPRNDELFVDLDSLDLAGMCYNDCSALLRQGEDFPIQKNKCWFFKADELDLKNMRNANKKLQLKQNSDQLHVGINDTESLAQKTKGVHQLNTLSENPQPTRTNKSGFLLSGKKQTVKSVNRNLFTSVVRSKLDNMSKGGDFPLQFKTNSNDQQPDEQTEKAALQQEKLQQHNSDLSRPERVPDNKQQSGVPSIREKIAQKILTSVSTSQKHGTTNSIPKPYNSEIQGAQKPVANNDTPVMEKGLKPNSCKFSHLTNAPKTSVKCDDPAKPNVQLKKIAIEEDSSENFMQLKKVHKTDESPEAMRPLNACSGDLSIVEKRQEILSKCGDKLISCSDASLATKQPQKRSRSGQAPVPAKKPEKLGSCGNLSPPEKQSEIISHCGKPSQLKQLKQLHKVNDESPTKNLEISSENDKSANPTNQFEEENGIEHVSMTTKKPDYQSEIKDLSTPAKKLEKIEESKDLALAAEQTLTKANEEPDNKEKCDTLSLPLNQPKDLQGGYYLSLPTKQPTENVDLPLALIHPKNHTENVSLLLQAKQLELSSNCDASSDVDALTVAVIDQEHKDCNEKNESYSGFSILASSSALAFLLAGFYIFKRYYLHS